MNAINEAREMDIKIGFKRKGRQPKGLGGLYL